MTAEPDIFDTGAYASGLGQRLRRVVELGPKYYLFDLPRYWWQRRNLGLPVLDWEALLSPARSFRPTSYQDLPLPPHYQEALASMKEAGVVFNNPRVRTEAIAGMWWQARGAVGD